MVPRLGTFLRRGPRPRTADDDDWGTASPDPPIPMESNNHITMPDAPAPSSLEIDAIERDSAVLPEPSKIEQLKAQELTSYTLIFSPALIISLYFAIGIVFVPIGSAIVAGSSKIVKVGPIRYDNRTECERRTEEEIKNGRRCALFFNVTQTVQPPIYMYYAMSNYFQNARKYAKSRSDPMNQGQLPKIPFDVENCSPWLYRPDVEDRSFDPKKLIYPCGLTARSFFNDTFTICKDKDGSGVCDSGDAPLRVKKDGIAWWTDREHKFRNGTGELFTEPAMGIGPNDGKSANELLSDEDFIVWMRLSAFPDFSKLYRIIDEPLEPNLNYIVQINNRYPVSDFDGTKSFYFTTTQWFGDENVFLGTAFLVVGFVALFIAATLLVKHIRHPRPPASSDPSIILRELAKLTSEFKS